MLSFKSVIKLFQLNSLQIKHQPLRCLANGKLDFDSFNKYSDERQQDEPQYRRKQGRKETQSKNAYHTLYAWNSLDQFADVLTRNVIYNESGLVAINKPWGVGIHNPEITITKKNQDQVRGVTQGSPKYCIAEALPLIAKSLETDNLFFAYNIERFNSGIILLVKDEATLNCVKKCIRRASSERRPFMTYWCVTKGWPIMRENVVKEKVGIRLIETDELGDHKEPIIVSAEKLTNKMIKKILPDGMRVKTIHTEMKILQINKSLSCSLVELTITDDKWKFLQCYLADKTSFILGDLRFSRRVHDILGTPTSHHPSQLNFTYDFEPIPTSLALKLSVKANNQIPLMAHHQRIVLLNFKGKDLTIEVPVELIPHYFQWTLDQLELNPFNDCN